MVRKTNKKSRYIPKEEKDKVDNSSNFKCSWCGVNLSDRHHIHHFSEGGENNAENLILLCPNCHRLAHQGKISEKELKERRKKISGEIDRSSGFFQS